MGLLTSLHSFGHVLRDGHNSVNGFAHGSGELFEALHLIFSVERINEQLIRLVQI